MESWLQVALIAFVAQLTVLPGEKAQFIIAALSTRYHPLLVVAAAGSAFAGWTALEIAFGNLLQGALPTVYLDIVTGLLFLLFAGLLLQSAPDSTDEVRTTDGGSVLSASQSKGLEVTIPIINRPVPKPVGGFLPIFALMAFGEFGDKTQLITITLAAQYAHGSAIWVGEMAAIIPVSLLNAYFFFKFSHRFDLRTAHLVGAALFAFFGVDTLQAMASGVSIWETFVSWIATLGRVVLTGAIGLVG